MGCKGCSGRPGKKKTGRLLTSRSETDKVRQEERGLTSTTRLGLAFCISKMAALHRHVPETVSALLSASPCRGSRVYAGRGVQIRLIPG